MKKIIFALVIVGTVAGTVFATNKGNKGGGKKSNSGLVKGAYLVSTQDSTFTIRASDSAALAGQMPDGYKLVQKPR